MSASEKLPPVKFQIADPEGYKKEAARRGNQIQSIHSALLEGKEPFSPTIDTLAIDTLQALSPLARKGRV